MFERNYDAMPNMEQLSMINMENIKAHMKPMRQQ